MGVLRSDYVYTHAGLQRPVFLGGGKDVRYVLEVGDGEACVQVTYDPLEHVDRGRVRWETCDAVGGVYGVTGLRVLVRRVDGWCVLRVEEGF